MLLQACLGIDIDAWNRTLHIDRPELPFELERLAVYGLTIADERVDVVFERVGSSVTATPMGHVPPSIKILVRA